MKTEALLNEAQKARSKAYTPYSNFKVGTALLTKDGIVYHGCNIENSSFSTTICAERCAIFKAVSEGKTKFVKLAMVTDAKNLTTPCGSCLQVIHEFCDQEFELILSNGIITKVVTFKDLLPMPFSL